MKKTVPILTAIAGLLLVTACKKQTIVAPDFANAYARFIMVDAPGSARVQFYMDGKINVNGDSVIYNPDGTVFTPDPSISTTSLVNYPSGGYTDNTIPDIPGVYGYYSRTADSYAMYPNPTDRIALAPILDGYNYFNWAAIPAKDHQVSFYSVVSASLYGNPVFAKGADFLDQQINLEGGAIQTFFLINQAPCKNYAPAGIEQVTGLPIYNVGETINFYSDQYSLVSLKDHPNNLPKFNDSSAYIRFVNLTPTYLDQALNANTASLDVYLAPLYGRPDYVDYYYGTNSNTADSIGKEFPIAKNLTRFASTVDAPFYELNLAPQMRNINDTASAPGQPRLPHYFRVLAYTSGHSAATGDQPVAQGDWLATYNTFEAIDYTNQNAPLGPALDSWLLRSDGTSLHPAICTIPIAVSLEPYPSTLSTNYLSFRSCIDYIKAGINSVYYQ